MFLLIATFVLSRCFFCFFLSFLIIKTKWRKTQSHRPVLYFCLVNSWHCIYLLTDNQRLLLSTSSKKKKDKTNKNHLNNVNNLKLTWRIAIDPNAPFPHHHHHGSIGKRSVAKSGDSIAEQDPEEDQMASPPNSTKKPPSESALNVPSGGKHNHTFHKISRRKSLIQSCLNLFPFRLDLYITLPIFL